MQKPVKIKIVVIGLLFIFLTTVGLRCKFITPSQRELLEPIELTWWGTLDERSDLDQIINDYRASHPNITVTYRKLRAEEFEKALLDALAEDRGPDIFSLENNRITEYLSKIEPLPKSTTMAYEVTQRSLGIKEETLIEIRETPSITPSQLRDTYLDIVYHDVVRANQIYGLPLFVDTLALFYNRDLLNNAGIALPPSSWLDVQESVKKLTFQDQTGQLIQSGVAMGTAQNVAHAVDILSLLMMQNGAQMTDGNRITFGFVPPSFPDKTYNPGPEAVRFYTDFAQSVKEVYTWSNDAPNSLDAFAQGLVAMMFGYSADVKTLVAKRQGKLNYGIAAVPQIEGRPSTNIGRYQVQVVSKKGRNVNAAWDFLQFISARGEAEKYLATTKRPTALRALVGTQLDDETLGTFANELLTSRNWYRGNDATAMQNAMQELIETVRDGGDLRQAVDVAMQKIQQTLQ